MRYEVVSFVPFPLSGREMGREAIDSDMVWGGERMGRWGSV